MGPELSVIALETLRSRSNASLEMGLFCKNTDEVKRYGISTSLCVFNMSSRHLFENLHRSQLFEQDVQMQLRNLLVRCIFAADLRLQPVIGPIQGLVCYSKHANR